MKIILLFLCFLPMLLLGQNAEFNVGLIDWMDEDDSLYFVEMEWKIDGQNLKLGDKPIRMKSLNSVDTIFYTRNNESTMDTFICRIEPTGKYLFSYNVCCSGFDVYSFSSDKSIDRNYGSVNFTLTNADSLKTYIFSVGENSEKFIGSGSTTLQPSLSPMTPNLYSINLEDESTPRLKDEWEFNGKVNIYEYPESYMFEFNYMPLSEGTLFVVYDVKTGKLELK